ncbi:uncharacterized protein ISCGN_030013 [Ixodes scapularis]
MYWVLLAIAAILSVQCISASKKFPEVNPELGPWQDVEPVFPLKDEWYVTYRNYEDDPVFGSNKCLKATQESPETEDGHPVVLSYKGLEERKTIMLTTMPGEGYTVNNRIKAVPEGGEAVEYHAVYGDFDVCAVIRMTYISDDALQVFVTKSHYDKYGRNASCCDFIYTMLAGSSQKYDIYDESCDTPE